MVHWHYHFEELGKALETSTMESIRRDFLNKISWSSTLKANLANSLDWLDSITLDLDLDSITLDLGHFFNFLFNNNTQLRSYFTIKNCVNNNKTISATILEKKKEINRIKTKQQYNNG